ncbi:MAG: hypothetical protein CMB99_04955 [Flavobacteriaceae bacterium]|nr:hypothetical protein [Flavobacteriaceae bacterium]|tara:strand:- start:111576 stop:112403 length:828 start_codon:yes stop_codon:yes gene_type:complete
MGFLKKIFDFYLNSSIHVAIAVYALLRVTEYYYPYPFKIEFIGFIFFATITGYNFVKYAGFQKWHFKKLAGPIKLISIFSWICFLITLYFARQLTYKTLSYALIPTALTVMYAVPFLSGFERNLRSIAHLKILVVALCWVLATMVLHFIDIGYTFTANEIGLSVQRFLLVVVWILPFEIRDLQYDKISLQTVPQKLGVPNTKRLGLALLMISVVLEFLFSPGEMQRNVFMIVFFITLIFLMRAKPTQSKYYSSFWVESIPIVWWLLLFGYDNFLR